MRPTTLLTALLIVATNLAHAAPSAPPPSAAILDLPAPPVQPVQRYKWDCRDNRQKAAPGKTVMLPLEPGQRHYILTEGHVMRVLIGVTKAGNCSTATLQIGDARYQCVPAFVVDETGQESNAVDRSSCGDTAQDTAIR